MAESDKENKITFEELAPSLQELFKGTVTKDAYDELAEKLNSIADNLTNLTDQFVKKTEVWEAFHKLEDNYNPGTSDTDWNKNGMYIINYNKPTINNQPTSTGQLINIPYDKDTNYSTQLFISQPDGNLYIRASNGSINGTKFKKIMTSDDVSGIPAVGRIIMYAYNINPSTEYPGTKWVRISTGCYLYSGSPSIDETAIKGSTTDITTKTGSATLKIAETNLPPHSHNDSITSNTGAHQHWSCGALPRSIQFDACNGNDNNNALGYGDGCWQGHKVDGHTSTDGAHTHSISSTLSPNCNSTPLANNPYGCVVAAWYRIS